MDLANSSRGSWEEVFWSLGEDLADPFPPPRPSPCARVQIGRFGKPRCHAHREQVVGIKNRDSPDWWMAALDDGREGWVPASYLEML